MAHDLPEGRGPPLSYLQKRALALIELAGEEGLDFHWYPERNRKVTIHGGTEAALQRLRLIKVSWRKGRPLEGGGSESIKSAKLTQAGRHALLSGYLAR